MTPSSLFTLHASLPSCNFTVVFSKTVTVFATVGAGVATDVAGNSNEVSTSSDNTVIYDTTPPAISDFNISPNPGAVGTPFAISATFTDALSFGFVSKYITQKD